MATIHNCRWEWCREAFDKHSDLVDHIKAHMIRGRPITRKKASDVLRTEGYTPEEIAARLIPGYVPASQPTNDPPHQSPNSSPPIPRTPQSVSVQVPEVSQDSAPSQAATLNQSLAVEPPRTPTQLISTSPTKSLDINTDMPPSSPPPPSPTPLSPQHTPISRRFEDMSIDEPGRGNTEAYTHVLVPVSSPPAAGRRDGSAPASARSSRLKRRSSFSLMSSSVSPDEFTGPRYQPLPESPSVTVMLAERERELKEKERERDNMRAAEKEREQRKQTTKEGGRAGPGPSTEATGLKAQGSWAGRGSPPRRAQNIIRFRGRGRGIGRGRGLNITSMSTPARALNPAQAKPQPPAAPKEIFNHPPPLPTLSPFYTPPEAISASQDTVEQLMSEFTHADSDEEIHANIMDNLGDPNSGLQTQAPYVSQTQESYGNSEAAGSRGGTQGQIPPSGSQRSQARVRGRG